VASKGEPTRAIPYNLASNRYLLLRLLADLPLMMPYQRFRAWNACHELAIAVYQATNSWPRSELYGLTSQTRKAAYSAPACIAEGSAKRGRTEFRRYLDISNGSLSELSYALQLARDLKMVDAEGYERLEALRARAGRLTWLLYRSVQGEGGRDCRSGKGGTA
jgi:four helix bundle protein